MMNDILIVGYGNIGKHLHKEFSQLNPDIYDPYIGAYARKTERRYDFAFICVPTDRLPDGGCDISSVESAIQETAAKIIVIKSTVPPATTDALIKKYAKKIVFSPESYGVTQHCKADPGFVVLSGDKSLCEQVATLYSRVKNGDYKFCFTETVTAELYKYMLNAFLALKVTFCCEFADIAHKYGVSYAELRELFVADERVGKSHTFVYPEKPYYDSHCFNKDIPALVKFSQGTAPLMERVNELNLSRKAGRAEACPEQFRSEKIYVGNAPGPLIEQTLQLRNAKIRKNREQLIARINGNLYKYYCSICLIIRDENEYLEEWLKWHIGQGVEHFYIYDHASKEPVKEFIRALGAEISSRVTVTDWRGTHADAQPEAYNDCLRRFGSESRWIGFIDADEQVRVKTSQTLPEFLRSYEDYAGVFAVWLIYDADGQVRQSNEPLRKRFTHVNYNDAWAIRMGKVFVQALLMREIVIHNGCAERGFYIVDEHKNKVEDYSLMSDKATTDYICIDHYYTKSYEEWVKKLKRGCGHSKYQRKYEEFFKINRDLEHCRENIILEQRYEVSDDA